MAIKALKPRLAEAGKIKIGGLSEKGKSKKSGKGQWFPPVKYDEMHVTTLERNDKNNALIDDHQLMWRLRYYNASKEVRKKVDTASDKKEISELLRPVKVRKIPIYLHSDDIDEVLRTEYSCYIGRQPYKSCDGETCTFNELRKGPRGMEQTGRRRTAACECPKGPSGYVSPRYWDEKTPTKKNFICKPNGEFRCLINMPEAAGPGSVYVFRTTGWNSILSLYGSLIDIRDRCGRHLSNVPCELVMHRARGKDQSGRNVKFWAVHVEMDVDLITALSRIRQLETIRAQVSGGAPPPKAIVARADEIGDDSTVGAEFYPANSDLDDEEIVEASFEEARYVEHEEEDRDRPPDMEYRSEPPHCPKCGSVDVMYNGSRWLCNDCGPEQAAAATGERQPGEDREEDEVAEEEAQDARELHEEERELAERDEHTDLEQIEQLGMLRREVPKIFREYGSMAEHPDGLGALYRAVCESAGLGKVVQMEDATVKELARLKEFLLEGIKAMQTHEPAADEQYEDDLPWEEAP